MSGVSVAPSQLEHSPIESLSRSQDTPFWRRGDFWYAEVAAFLARAVFLIVTAGMKRSVDLDSWHKVANMLESGRNPYAVTTFLNWPPFWMQVIYLLEKYSAFTGVPFVLCVQAFLILVDLVLIAALYALLQKLAPEKSPGRLVLWAISLNPVCILLTCQHGNFDGLVALSVVLFLVAIVNYRSQRDPLDWLLACLMLGIAILIKTTPFVLAPLLLLGVESLRRRALLLGACLALGPVALGMSIIYVLAPAGVSMNVLAYRSIPGYFGITGLLGLMHMDFVSSIYQRGFPLLLILGILGLAILVRRRPNEPARFALFAAACAMLAIPLFGPGYGPQYLFWSIPLLAAVYHVTGDVTTRRVLLVAYEIAVVCYLIEYSFFSSHGALVLQIWPKAVELSMYAGDISTKGGQTLVRLPLFLILLAVFVRIAREVRRAEPSGARRVAGSFPLS